MARFTRLLLAIRATLASTAALSAMSATQVGAETEASRAYSTAKETGSISALERFIERYPLSPEASDAFCDIVVLTRGSKLANMGPNGLCANPIITKTGQPAVRTRQISIY